MRRCGLLWILLAGCISLGDYRGARVLPENTWEVGLGSPLVIAAVDTSEVEAGPGVYPEIFVRYGLLNNLEVEGRAVTLFPFTGAMGGGVRWGLRDSGLVTTVGLHGMVFALGVNTSSFTLFSLYPGIWVGKGNVHASARLLWLFSSVLDDTTGSAEFATPGLFLTVGFSEQADIPPLRLYPEVTVFFPFSEPGFLITAGLGVSFRISPPEVRISVPR